MATYRFPHDEPWGGKKPRCPSCGHELKFKDFAPIWAYVVNRGKCKFCGVKVTPVYLCTEIYCLLAFILCYCVFGFNEIFLLVSTIAVFTVINTITELESRVVTDKALFLLFFTGCVYRALVDQSIYGLFYGGIYGMFVGIALKHLRAVLKHQSFDWHQAFLQLFTPDYVYVRLLIVVGGILPLYHFTVVMLLSCALILLCKLVWQRFRVPLPLPYAGVTGALMLGALLFA